MKISSIVTAVIGLTIGFGSVAVIAAVTGPVMVSPSPGVSGNVPVMSGTVSIKTSIMTQTGTTLEVGGKVGAQNTVSLPYTTKSLLQTGTFSITQTDIATPTPSANAVPMSLTSGKIDLAWLPFLNGTFYFEDTASDISTYYLLKDGPSVDAEVTDTVGVTSAAGEVLIESYATASGVPGSTVWKGGTYYFNLWRYVNNVAGNSQIVFRVYKRTSGGTETELFNVSTGEINDTSATYEEVTTTQGDFTVDASDRIVVKVYAKTTSEASINVSFVYSGNARASHVHTPMSFGGTSGGSGVINDVSIEGGYVQAETVTGTATSTKTSISANPKFTITPASVGAPPTSRTVCGHPLSADVTCTPADVGALPATNVNVTTNYLAKGGASAGTLANSSAYEDATKISSSLGIESTSSYGFVSSIAGSTSALKSILPAPTYPRAALQVGDIGGGPTANVGLIVTPMNSIAGGIKTTFLEVATNSNPIDAAARSVTISVSSGLVNLITALQDGQVAGGNPIAISPQGVERARFGNGLSVGDSTFNSTDPGAGVLSTQVSIKSQSAILRGSTSGAVTHGVAATTESYTMLAPSTAPGANQAIQYPSGGGQGTWFTPIASTGINYSGCTTTSSTGGLVTACDTTARVAANAAITASGATYKIVQYDTKGLVTAGTNATPANIGAAASTVDMIAGAGLTGGGTLSANRTFNVGASPDGSISVSADYIGVGVINDTQHGDRGGGSRHLAATTSYNGFMSAADKTKLDGISGMSTTTPASPNATTQSYGSSTYAARADHRHAGELHFSWTGPQSYYTEKAYGSYAQILIEFPVYWGNMPSSLAAWATWTISSRSPDTTATCYTALYTGSQTRGTLGGTNVFPYVSTTMTPYAVTMAATSWAFTKPSNGTNGIYSRIQVYGYCSPATSNLSDIHIHITGNY